MTTKWSEPRILCTANADFMLNEPYTGPAVYLIGVLGGESPKYVGMTSNLAERMRSHSSLNSHIASYIRAELRLGRILTYKYCGQPSDSHAGKLEQMLLSEYQFEWNTLGQGTS